jgi:antitoxin VapB
MALERRIKLFRIGPDQVVEIPPEFELPGEEAIIRKQGDRLIIEPDRPKKSLVELLDSWEPVEDEFPPIEGLPHTDVEFWVVGRKSAAHSALHYSLIF